MSNQYPQQPYGQYPQQPYGQPPFQPQPPKKPSTGKIVGLLCLGVVGLFVLIVIVAAASGGSSDSSKSGDAKPAATANGKPADSDKPASGGKGRIDVEPEPKPEKPEKKTVIFKVWGTAPAGALGTLDITYGSDSDNRDGAWKNGKFTAELPLDDDALYYTVMAQLQGSGDIQCSVTVDGHTEKGHASGGYNICHAQANSGLLGGWN